MKSALIFSAGVLVGTAFVLNELIKERLIVNNHLDGTVTLHYTGVGTKPEV